MKSTSPLHWQSRHNIFGFKPCSGRTNKIHLHSWTLYPWSSRARRDQTLLCPHQSTVCRYLHKKPWKTEIPRGKKSSLSLKIQNVVRWTSRRSVENPDISYSELLFLIPGSRAITSWSFYTIHIMKTWTLIYDVTMTSWVQTLIYGTILMPYDYWIYGAPGMLCMNLYL